MKLSGIRFVVLVTGLFCLYPAFAEPTIVLFGDSTTAKRGALQIYADHLAAETFGDGKATVINAGVPGHNTDHARARFEEDVLAKQPDAVVVQFGINDAAVDVWKDPPATEPRVQLKRYRSNLEHFIERLRKEDVPVVLMTPNPLRWTEKMREMYGKPPYDPGDELGFDKPVGRYATEMRKIAAEQKVPLVDIHKLFSERETDTLLLDGVHPNAEGHATVAEALMPVLREALGENSPSHHSDQWERGNVAITVTDLTIAEPASALSDRRKMDKWKVFEYETANYSGKCLSVGIESTAPDVTIPLDLDGWHAVYLGLSTITDLVRPAPNQIEAKFSDEKLYHRLSNHLPLGKPRRDRVQEVFLDVADITDRGVVLSSVHDRASRVHYVRAIPLTEKEIARVKADRSQKETRNLVATLDGFGWIHAYRPTTEEELASAFGHFENSDFGTWWFQPGGADLVMYPTEVGSMMGGRLDAFPRPADRDYTESVRLLHEKGIDPLVVAIEEAERQDVELLVCLRAQGWKAAPPWEEFFLSEFYETHPEWRCVDYDGTPTMHMSYAADEVQDHLIEVYREALQRGAHGAGFLFHRGLPLMLWEKPFREKFEKRFGVDPREIPEDDPRVAELRAEIMSNFIAKIRSLLDEEQARRGDETPRLKLAISTFATEADNRKFGLDVEHWIGEKWIDQIGIAWFAYYTSGLGKREGDTEYYVKIAEGTDVDVFPFHIGWKVPSAEELLDRIHRDYQRGAEGVAFWDPAQFRGWEKGAHEYWPLIKNLGHRGKVKDRSLLFLPRYDPLTRIGQNHFSRWYPNTGF